EFQQEEFTLIETIEQRFDIRRGEHLAAAGPIGVGLLEQTVEVGGKNGREGYPLQDLVIRARSLRLRREYRFQMFIESLRFAGILQGGNDAISGDIEVAHPGAVPQRPEERPRNEASGVRPIDKTVDKWFPGRKAR